MTIVIISLDYDGCGDALRIENLNRRNIEMRGQQYRYTLTNSEQLEMTAIVSNTLLTFIKNHQIKGNKVILLIGSKRQNKETDLYNSTKNNNFLCTETFYDFATKEKLDFFPNVLLDEATLLKIKYDVKYNYGNNPQIRTLKIKAALVLNQLKHIAQTYPKDEIKFLFIDDDPKDIILSHLENVIKKTYEKALEPFEYPKNINFTLVKYNYNSILNKIYNYKPGLAKELNQDAKNCADELKQDAENDADTLKKDAKNCLTIKSELKFDITSVAKAKGSKKKPGLFAACTCAPTSLDSPGLNMDKKAALALNYK